MTPDERAELERELAADLDVLDDDDSDEQRYEDVGEYVRLDVDELLRRGGAGNDGKKHDEEVEKSDVWAQLMSSVAHCEREIFCVFQVEMDELRSSLALPAVTLCNEAELRRASAANVNEQKAETRAEPSSISTESTTANTESNPIAETREDASMGILATMLSSRAEQSPLVAESMADIASNRSAEKQDDFSIGSLPTMICDLRDGRSVSDASGGVLHPAPSRDKERVRDMLASPTHSFTVERLVPQSVCTLSPDKLRTGVDASRSSRAREIAFSRTHLAQQDLAKWMETKQRELEAEEARANEQMRQSKLERSEGFAMEQEERIARYVIETGRVARETTAMRMEDRLSQAMAELVARELEVEALERQRMGQDEARTRRFLHLSRESLRREKLAEEWSRARRWHLQVMDELVIAHAARAEAMRKSQDAERRRAHREMCDMRSEEHWMVRVVIHERMVRDAEWRQQESTGMEHEDTSGRRRRDIEREVEERSRMEKEEIRSRVWETLWRLRMKALGRWVGGKPKRDARRGLNEWKHTIDVMKALQQAKNEKQREQDAGERIYRCLWRHYMNKKIERCRATKAAHAEATLAAKIVQSAYRGFHVRRKFFNALEMAQTIAFDGDDEFGEVNLEDLIQIPPELDEDWEKPAMRLVPKPALEWTNVYNHKEENRSSESFRQEEEYCEEALRAAEAREQTPARPNVDVVQAESGNLAAIFWGKMRKKSQKQKMVQEERQRQQDPVYRVKKLLARTSKPTESANNGIQQTPGTSNTAATPSVTWSVSTDKKKTPKVKLPSLVERLRMKTAAAR